MKRDEKLESMGRERIAKMLNIPAAWLLQVFIIESQNNPQAKNPFTNAAGLIQFMPSTLRPWGLTTDDVLGMNYNDQLNLVYKYLSPYKGKFKSAADLYLSIFYPYAMAQKDTYVMGSERNIQSAIFNQNPGFATPENKSRGYYTKKDIVNYVQRVGQQKPKPSGSSVPKKQDFFSKFIVLLTKLFER